MANRHSAPAAAHTGFHHGLGCRAPGQASPTDMSGAGTELRAPPCPPAPRGGRPGATRPGSAPDGSAAGTDTWTWAALPGGWAGREPTREVAVAQLRGPNCLPHHRAGAPGLLSSGFANTAGSDQVFPHFCTNGPCFQMRHSFQVLLCPGSSRPLFPPDALFLAHCPVLPPPPVITST